MTTIQYNGINPFSGLAPTPLLSRSVSMIKFGNRWGQKHEITLKGQLTGICLQYADYVNRQQQLLSGFSRDLQSLNVYDGASFVTGYDFVKINSINFDANKYAQGFIPFDISITAYPSGYFSGQYGVLNPVNSFDFSEDNEGVVKIAHKVSAQGFATNSSGPSNATDNAKAWVNSQTGWSSQVLPAFVSGVSGDVCLQTIHEDYDRLNGKYSIDESYIADAFGTVNGGLLRYTTDFSSGIENGICSMSVKGSIKGCKYQDLSSLRARYAAFDSFSEAVNRFQPITDRTDLNSYPLSKSISEDSTGRVITFEYVYSDDLKPIISIVIEIGFDYDYENDVISANIKATVSSRKFYDSTKWDDVKGVADAVDLLSLLNPVYDDYVAAVAPHLATFPLNTLPNSYSRTDNEFATIITLTASYSNAVVPPLGLDTYSSHISITPALHKFAAQPVLDGETLVAADKYYVFDMGFKSRARAQVEVQGAGVDPLPILKTAAYNLMIDYFPGTDKIMEAQNNSVSNAPYGKKGSASANYSCEQTEFALI